MPVCISRRQAHTHAHTRSAWMGTVILSSAPRCLVVGVIVEMVTLRDWMFSKIGRERRQGQFTTRVCRDATPCLGTFENAVHMYVHTVCMYCTIPGGNNHNDVAEEKVPFLFACQGLVWYRPYSPSHHVICQNPHSEVSLTAWISTSNEEHRGPFQAQDHELYPHRRRRTYWSPHDRRPRSRRLQRWWFVDSSRGEHDHR